MFSIYYFFKRLQCRLNFFAIQKKKQQTQKNKEVKFHVNTDKHDFDLKIKHILEFLGKGYKVRVSLLFRGREMAHKELGVEVLERVIAELGEGNTNVDAPPKLMGRTAFMQLSPVSKKR